MTEAAIQSGLFRDLYVSLGEAIPNSNGAWAVRVYIKPFVDWIWAGCLFMMLGGALAISDRRYRIHSARKAHAGANTEALPSTVRSAKKGRVSARNKLATKGK